MSASVESVSSPPPRPGSKTIAVLGGGITGLVAAHRLIQLGHRVRIFEQAGRTGGVIQTEHEDGWLIESGPNSLLSGESAVDRLIGELGLAAEKVFASPQAKNRYVVRRGRPVAMPLSPGDFLASSLFSVAAKTRLFAELLRRPRQRPGDVSVAEVVRSHFGTEFADYALDPFVAGIYAGNPAKLSARYSFPKLWEFERSHGSLVRGLLAQAKARRSRGETRPEPFSFRGGLQVLTDALAARIPAGAITLHAQLDAIVPGQKWGVIWHDESATHTQTFDAVVVALPALSLARLRLGALGERPLAALGAVEHPPLSSLFLGFARSQVAHPLDGFGLLVPTVEKRSLLGVLFSSSLFPDRAPPHHVALTVMVGGSRQPELAALSTSALLDRVRPDLAELLGIRGEPTFVRHRFWPHAIPQFNLGYGEILGTIAAVEREHTGLFIGGQARDGVSLPACIAAGEKLAAAAGA